MKLTVGDARHSVPWYNYAWTRSLTGNVGEALKCLEKTLILGFLDLRHLRSDPDLTRMGAEARFEAILSRYPVDPRRP